MTGTFCPWCGSKVGDGFTFCRKCGRRLDGTETQGGGPAQTDKPSSASSPLPVPPTPSPVQPPAPPNLGAQTPDLSPSLVAPTSRPRPDGRVVAVTVIIVVAIVMIIILAAIALQPKPASSSNSPGGGGGGGGGGGDTPKFTISSVTIDFSYPSGSSEFFGPGGLNACPSACPAVFPNAQTCNLTAPIEVVGSAQIVNQGSQTHAINSISVSPFNGPVYGQVNWYVFFVDDQSQSMATPYYLGPGVTLPYSAVVVGLDGSCNDVSGAYGVTIYLGVS